MEYLEKAWLAMMDEYPITKSWHAVQWVLSSLKLIFCKPLSGNETLEIGSGRPLLTKNYLHVQTYVSKKGDDTPINYCYFIFKFENFIEKKLEPVPLEFFEQIKNEDTEKMI